MELDDIIKTMLSGFKIVEDVPTIETVKVNKMIPKQYRHTSFEEIDVMVYKNHQEVKRFVERFREMESPSEMRNGLYIQGGCGRGKTMLAAAISNHFGHKVRFTSIANLIQNIKDGFQLDEPYNMHYWLNAELVILDDMGAEKTTEFVEAELYRLLDHRYNNGLKTIITSNIPFDQIPAIYRHNGERIKSRLTSMCAVLKLQGDDQRRLMI